MPQVSYEKRIEVIALFRANHTKSFIAKQVGCSRHAVRHIVGKWLENGQVRNKKRGHRQKKLSKRSQRWLKRYVSVQPRSTLDDLTVALHLYLGVNAHKSTVRRNLKMLGLRSCVAVKKPFISPINRMKRLHFSKKHLHIMHGHLSKVVWSDESSFQLFGHQGQQRVWRHPGERYTSKFVVPTVKHGGGSLMIWGMMSRYGVGPIYRVDGTMRQHQYVNVLQNVMLPHVTKQFKSNFLFQQDNAPCHKSAFVKNWFSSNDITPWCWPPQSPDLSPIENLWRDVSLGLKKCKPSNLEELWTEIQRIRYAIPVERC